MPSVFDYIPSRSRCGNVPNELVHRAGPLFLDNHYCGYQYACILDCSNANIISYMYMHVVASKIANNQNIYGHVVSLPLYK